MKKDKRFTKYQQRGAYHQEQVSRSIFNFNAFVDLRYHQVLNLIPKNKKLKLLDIGCGEGVLLSLIQQATKVTVVGIDPEAHQLKTPDNLKIISASAYQLPFEPNSFDYVISTEVIEHLKKPNKMLQEAVRVLKPSGTAIVTTPVKLTKIPQDKMHVKEYTPAELQDLLKQYFNQVIITASHPVWLKKLYLFTLIKFGQYHFDLFRWLINLLVLVFKFNPFNLPAKNPSQQIAVCQNKKVLK